MMENPVRMSEIKSVIDLFYDLKSQLFLAAVQQIEVCWKTRQLGNALNKN